MITCWCQCLFDRSARLEYSTLEFDSQGELTGAISSVFCRLRSAQDAEGRRNIDLRCRRSEVSVVKHVGKRRLEAHSYCLCDAEDFGEAEAGRDCAGALQDTNSGVAKASGTGRSRRECCEIEVLRA